MKYVLTLCISLVAANTGFAEVHLPRFFSDNMILQQNQMNSIWGWAQPNEEIVVQASWGDSASALTNSDGQWYVFLKTPTHGTGHSIKINGTNVISIRNVAVGEVWLCIGQSNMGWSTGNSFESGGEAAADMKDPWKLLLFLIISGKSCTKISEFPLVLFNGLMQERQSKAGSLGSNNKMTATRKH